jgi:hypothetical protein
VRRARRGNEKKWEERAMKKAVIASKPDQVKILPPAPGKCPVCAGEHDAKMPHDKDSLYYQMKFRQAQGRFPTWADAMAHCTPEIKAHWKRELERLGVRIEGYE